MAIRYINFLKKILFSFQNLKEPIFHRITENEIHLLARTNLFKNLDKAAFYQLAETVYLEYYLAGSYIVEQDAKSLYIVVKGSVEIQNSQNSYLAKLGRGDYFGEETLVKNSSRGTYKAFALDDVVAIKINTDHVLKSMEYKKAADSKFKKMRPLPRLNTAVRTLYNALESIFHKVSATEIELIENTGLFDKLDEASFLELLNSMHLVYCCAGELILKQGSLGDAFYIIKNGSVRVFTEVNDEKIALARLNEGAYFGEQALLGHYSKTRNANIEAILDTVLIKFDASIISKLFHIDKHLEAHLEKIGEKQILANLSNSLDIYQSMVQRLQQRTNQALIKVVKNEVIFKIGDKAEYVYVIAKGKIRIEIPSLPLPLIIFIKDQQIFGEVGALADKPRSGTAIAEEDCVLIKIEAKDFKQIYKDNPHLQQLLKTLGNAYTLPTRGMVQQYIGKTMGMNAITTLYTLTDGRKVVATHAVEQEYFVMEESPVPKLTHQYIYERPGHSKIEIGATEKYIVAIKCSGLWSDLSNACHALLERKNVLPPVLEAFSTTGKFNLNSALPMAVPDTVCDCMMVKKQTVDTLISEGVRSLAQISKKTGACSVCGSCRSRLLTMLGQEVWVPATMNMLAVHNENVVSYQLRPSLGKFTEPLPGQHVVIQVRIGEVWVERAYTLTDFLIDGHLTITVKKEKNGFFTQWLFNTFAKPIAVYVCQPQGNFILKMDTAPVLCFAGGIGITPFISFAKALKNSYATRALHIVYIASLKEDFIFVDELQEIAKQNPLISLTLWEKSSAGPLTEEGIAGFIEKMDKPDIYICGPEGWEVILVNTLEKIKYSADKVFIEKFTYANPIMV